MTVMQHMAATTLHYEDAPSLWNLAAPVAWALRKMGTRIEGQELGLVDDVIVFHTELGDIRILGASAFLRLEVISLEGDRHVASDLCRHIARIIGRETHPRAILHHSAPTDGPSRGEFAPFGLIGGGPAVLSGSAYLH